MNALIHHLRFLRPLRSALLVALYASMAYGFSKTFLRLDPAAAQLSAYLVALPLLTGVVIAGAALEPLHRPFALLLPGLRRRQLRFASIATALAALAITSISIWTTPAVSPVASLGLVAALLALPQLESHRYRSNLTELGTELTTGILLCLAFGHGLARALNTGPWLCLFGGLAFACFALHRGYARSAARLRSHVHFVAYQSRALVHFFNPAVSARWQTEFKASRQNPSVPAPPPARRRSIQPLGSSSTAWLPVLRELAFGAWRTAGSNWLAWTIGVALLAGFALFPSIGLTRGQPDYFTALAHIIDPRVSINVQFMGAMAFWLSVTLPTFPLPISRARLGRAVFLHFVTCWLFALLMPVAVLLLPSMVGQWVSGQTLPAFGVRPVFVTTLTLAPLLPLVLDANLNGVRRHMTMFLSISLTVILSHFVEKRIALYQLEPVGGLIFAALIAGSLIWMRQRILRHYATCDLLSGAAPTRLDAPAHAYTVATR
jgi:hypothetical protein